MLAAQRDHYLPLKVIKDQLDAIDRGLEPGDPEARLPRSHGGRRRPVTARISRADHRRQSG